MSPLPLPTTSTSTVANGWIKKANFTAVVASMLLNQATVAHPIIRTHYDFLMRIIALGVDFGMSVSLLEEGCP